MKVLVLPVSGGCFPLQIAGLLSLSKLDHDIIMGSSGGNLVSYMLLYSNNNIDRLFLACSIVDSSFYAKNWIPLPPLSLLYGFCKGSLYHSGDSNKFNGIITRHVCRSKEVWTGTYNKCLKKTRLFTNMATSRLDITKFNPSITNCMDLTFLDGDVESIITVSSASASIPAYVPPIIIDGHQYCDGGVMYASPLTPLAPCIPTDDIHIDYVNSFDINEAESKHLRPKNLLSVGNDALSDVIRSICVHDRATAISLLSGNVDQYHDITADQIETIRGKYRRSVLEVYPTIKDSLDIFKFTGGDVNTMVTKARDNIKFRLYCS
jgi:predicted acylesterase/phospholipase RssA